MSNAQTAINTAYEDNDADSSGLIAKVDNRLVKRKGIRKIAYLWNPTNNVKKLLESSAKRSLQGLDGLRAFSMMWIIMAHSALLPGEIGYDNPTAVIERFTEESAMFPVGANLGVDTFFFIAGVLTAYTSIKGMRKQMIALYKIPKQLAFFTLLRWLRLFPVYAYLMALYTFVFPLIGSGPFWFHMKSQVGLCKQYWWTNLLFINNFHPVSFYDNCMSWTWYLANYMQFSIIAMITLYVYIRSPTAGKVLALGLTIGLTILGFFLIDKNAYDSAKFQDAYYDKPYTRYPALSFGVYIGMILRDTPPKDLKLSQMTSFLVRHCSVGVILFTIYIFGYEYDRPDSIKGKLTRGWTVQELAAYDTFGRMAFVIGIAGLTYLCTVGGAGIYGKFLDLPFWEPFGKLTFGAYLVHPAIIRIFAFNAKTYFDQEPLNQGLNFLGIAVLAYSSAFLTYIAIELPFESMLMGLKGKKK